MKYAIKLRTVHALAREGATSEPIETCEQAASIVRGIVERDGLWDREVFIALAMDARGRFIGAHLVTIGTLTACLVHPREVYAPMLVLGAASIIVAHTHPSGDSSPSSEDLALTQRLRTAGEILGIPMLDHLVVTGTEHRSA